MVNGPVRIVRVRSTVTEAAGTPESVTLNVSGVAVMGLVGVPLMMPVAGSQVRPAGNVPPVTCQLGVGTPSVETSVLEYAAPTTPFGSDVGGMVSAADAMDILNVASRACPPESFNWNTSGLLVTTSVGVPVIAPLDESSVSPAGKVPETTCQP